MEDTLLSMIRTWAYREGNFKLSSGRRSHYLIDCKPLLMGPKSLTMIARCVIDLAEKVYPPVTTLAGVPIGGSIIATAAAVESRGYRTNPLDTAIPLDTAMAHIYRTTKPHIVIVDDVSTTGASILRTARMFREAGFTVSGAVVLVDRQEGAKEALAKEDINLRCGYTISDLRTTKAVPSGDKEKDK